MEASRSSDERGKWSQKRSASKICPAYHGHEKLGAGQIDKKEGTWHLADKADHLSLLQQAPQYQEDKDAYSRYNSCCLHPDVYNGRILLIRLEKPSTFWDDVNSTSMESISLASSLTTAGSYYQSCGPQLLSHRLPSTSLRGTGRPPCDPVKLRTVLVTKPALLLYEGSMMTIDVGAFRESKEGCARIMMFPLLESVAMLSV
ncbi:hypothetical protein BHM03_00026868 [Ensete ventricosum]|nr:hypothetical protein BHM03_00026868 [Ensete ventricosum]